MYNHKINLLCMAIWLNLFQPSKEYQATRWCQPSWIRRSSNPGRENHIIRKQGSIWRVKRYIHRQKESVGNSMRNCTLSDVLIWIRVLTDHWPQFSTIFAAILQRGLRGGVYAYKPMILEFSIDQVKEIQRTISQDTLDRNWRHSHTQRLQKNIWTLSFLHPRKNTYYQTDNRRIKQGPRPSRRH